MNERIYELAVQAKIQMVSEPRLQEFAELIIKQCAEIADTEQSTAAGCGYITKTKGMRIKEHFGIEQ
jgi:hypothetical protein